MKRASLFLLALLLAVTLAPQRLPAQSTDAAAPTDSTAPETPAAGTTVITSDELRIDENNHTAVFSGNVVAVGTNFTMHCLEMTVMFTKDSKIDTITAKGSVVIEQPGRITHSGQAEYFRTEDMFVLTDQPNIIDNKSKLFAPKITIYRTQQKLITEGRSRTEILDSSMSAGPGAAPAGADNGVK